MGTKVCATDSGFWDRATPLLSIPISHALKILPIYFHSGLWVSPPDANLLKTRTTPGLGDLASRMWRLAPTPRPSHGPVGAAELPIAPAPVAESLSVGLMLAHH
jgi:hypothetical protein